MSSLLIPDYHGKVSRQHFCGLFIMRPKEQQDIIEAQVLSSCLYTKLCYSALFYLWFQVCIKLYDRGGYQSKKVCQIGITILYHVNSTKVCVFSLVPYTHQKHSPGDHIVHDHSHYIIRAGECSVLYCDDRRWAAGFRRRCSGQY